MRIINLERGLPTIEEARKRLLLEIDNARHRNPVFMKIIHGYGSSGVGGTLGKAIRNSLKHRRKEGKVETYVGGENFGVFDQTARSMVEKYPQIKKDPDWSRGNPGITIAVLCPKCN